MIRVGLIGFGLSGRYLQAPFFFQHPRFELRQVVTTRQDPAHIFSNVERSPSLERVLADPSIDLVSICTPNETHYDFAHQTLLAGKHVLVEKPFAATPLQAQTLISLAKAKGKQIFVYQNRRFDSDFLTVQKIVQQGLLGTLVRYEAHFDRYKPLPNPKKWKEEAAPSTGILYDLGSHLLDQAIALFGTPHRVWGETYTERPNSSIDDAFDLRLDYGTLRVRLSASMFTREPTPRYALHGHNGSFLKFGIDQQEDQLKAGLWPNDPDFGMEPTQQNGYLHTECNGLVYRGQIETQRGHWMALFDNMAAVLLDGASPAIPLTDILAQLEIMERIKKEKV